MTPSDPSHDSFDSHIERRLHVEYEHSLENESLDVSRSVRQQLEQHQLERLPAPRSQRRFTRSQIGWQAVAASLLIIFGLTMVQSNRENQSRRASPAKNSHVEHAISTPAITQQDARQGLRYLETSLASLQLFRSPSQLANDWLPKTRSSTTDPFDHSTKDQRSGCHKKNGEYTQPTKPRTFNRQSGLLNAWSGVGVVAGLNPTLK